MTLQPGEPAPWFIAPTPSNARYEFHMAAGRTLLLAFLPEDAAVRGAMLETLRRIDPLLDGHTRALFGVLRDAESIARARDRGALRWIQDGDGAVGRLYGVGANDGAYVLVDPALRVLAVAAWDGAEALLARFAAAQPPDRNAPVLAVDGVFEPTFCRALIDHYDLVGGTPSGVMRQVDGETRLIQTDFKKRSDVTLAAGGDLQRGARERIIRRLVPEILKAFQFEVTWIERYLVACYDGETGGYFRPHRDNTTDATAHRRFACSINLNAEDFEGGDLRFPEFGARTYRPTTGGATVFSCSLLHEATAVTRGRRYAFLPFFHDHAGEAARRVGAADTGH